MNHWVDGTWWHTGYCLDCLYVHAVDGCVGPNSCRKFESASVEDLMLVALR